MKEIRILAAIVVSLATATKVLAVEDGLGTNHVRTLRAYDGIVLDGLKITSWAGVGASTLTNNSIATSMLQDNAVTTGKISAAVAGNGLAGGGALPLAVGQGDGISVTADAVAVDSSVVRTSGVQTISGTNTFLGQVVVPAPVADSHAATKLYVDTKVSGTLATGSAANDTLRWTGSVWTNSGQFTADAAGNVRIGSSLHVAGIQTNASDVVMQGKASIAGPLTVAGAQTNTGPLVLLGNVALGDAPGDTIAFLGTASTNLAMGSYKVTGLGAPTDAADAATKQYVDTKVSGTLATGSAANETLRWTGSVWTNNGQFTVDASGNASIGGAMSVAGTQTNTGTLTVLGSTTLGNDIASDTVSMSSKVSIAGAVVTVPSGTLDIGAATGITGTHIQRSYLKVRGSGGAVDISVSPQISAGSAGQLLTLQGVDDANTLKLDDGNGLALAGGISFTLRNGHIIQFIYDGTAWRELFRTVPAP